MHSSTPLRALPLRLGRSALVLWALTFAGCSAPVAESEDDPAANLLSVSVRTAKVGTDFRVDRQYQGQVEARRRSRIGFDLSGVLLEVSVDEGDEVRSGALLATLDVSRLSARKRQIEASVLEAETADALAASTLSRFEKAREREAVSPQDLDEAKRRREGASASLDRSRAELEAVEVDFAKSRLRAPYGGQVVARLADEGEAVAPGQPILELIETERPRVRVGVPLAVAGNGSVGEEANFEIGGETVSGRRLAVLPEQNERTRTVGLLFELDRPLGDLRVGQVARLHVSTALAEAGIALPSSALTESSRGLWSCLVAVPVAGSAVAPGSTSAGASAAGGVHELEQRIVEILEVGADQGEPLVIVRGAIEPGDLVVDAGLHRLVAGQRVVLAVATSNSREEIDEARADRLSMSVEVSP